MFRYFLSILFSHHRTLHSSIQPMLCSSTCSYVRLSMEGKLTSRICRRKFWHASISPTLTWEMRLAIRWNPFLLRNQRTNFGIGKYCFWIREKKVIYYLEEIKRKLFRERQDLISEIRRNDKRSSVKTIQRDPSEIDEGWNDEDNFFTRVYPDLISSQLQLSVFLSQISISRSFRQELTQPLSWWGLSVFDDVDGYCVNMGKDRLANFAGFSIFDVLVLQYPIRHPTRFSACELICIILHDWI